MYKDLMPFMGKMIKLVVISTITAVFFISGLMLCCEIGILPNNQFKAKNSSCCASAKADHLKNQHPTTCLCCQLSKSEPDRIQGSLEIDKKSQNNTFKNVNPDAFMRMPIRVASSFSSQGPPRAPSVPIYLQLSVLRL